MAKNMFYDNLNNNGDCRCANCPFMKEFDGEQLCSETLQEVSFHVRHGWVNKTCPYFTHTEEVQNEEV